MDSSLVIFTLITHLANLTNQNPNLRPAPLNKRILFQIVTTIPQQSRNNPAESPHSLHPTSSPPSHMSLNPGHIAHFDGVYALHVPRTRTHGAAERRRKYTRRGGGEDGIGGGGGEGGRGGGEWWGDLERQRRRRQAQRRNCITAQPSIKQRPVPELLRNRARDVKSMVNNLIQM